LACDPNIDTVAHSDQEGNSQNIKIEEQINDDSAISGAAEDRNITVNSLKLPFDVEDWARAQAFFMTTPPPP